MKEIIEKLERILELTDDYGIYVESKRGNAEHESELRYTHQKVKFNAIKALELINSENKEIAAMEKQYKYEKLEFGRASIALCDFESGHEQITKDAVGNYVLVGDAQTSVIAWVCDKLYRRIPLTQEDLDAQKVDELAELIRGMDKMQKMKPVTKAKTIIEWMKQEG